MRRSRVLGRSLLALTAGSLPSVARADGLYLKLSSPKAPIEAGRPFTMAVQLVATHRFRLPSEPLVLVALDGTSLDPPLRCRLAAGERFEVGASSRKPHDAGCTLVLTRPGRYRIRLRYRLPDRVIDSNGVDLTVEPASEARP